jgi:hypothetical protein
MTPPTFSCCAIALGLALLGHAHAQDYEAGWVTRPSAEEFSMFFPPEALTQRVEGSVMLECASRLDQRVDCTVVSETPQGWGFGRAALGLSRSFRMLPAVRDGQPQAGSPARVPVNFPQMSDARNGWSGTPDLPLWEDAPNAQAVRQALGATGHEPRRGRGVLSCRVNTDRSLACSITHESEPGRGYGEAAMALSRMFRVSERDGAFIARHATDAFVLPINFGFDPAFEPVSMLGTGVSPLQIPSPPREIVDRFYPQGARQAGVSGSASITCTAQTDGSFICAVTRESPEGHQFGEVASALTQSYLNAQAGAGPSGYLAGDQVQVDVPFELGS